MARNRSFPALVLLLVPAAIYAQGDTTPYAPSGPAIVAPAESDTIYGTPYKPGQPYKPPVAKPPTVPKPASSTPVPSGYGMPTIVIPSTPAPSTAPQPSKPAIPLPGQGPVIVKPAPSPAIPLPGQGPVIVKPAPSPAIPLPGQGPVIVKPAPSPAIPLPGQGPVIVKPAPSPATPMPPQGPVIVTPAPTAPPSTPVGSTPKPEPITSKPPATATAAPPPPGATPTEAPLPKGPSPREEEEERRRREARAAEAAMRAKQEAAAAAERAKQGLAYPDAQPIVPGAAVNIAPQTEQPSSDEIRGLGAKIKQLQKEAAVAPKPTPPEGKPPANDCDPSTPEQCAAIQRQLERQKREADRRLREELRRERERAEREQRRLNREAERREREARREANRQERQRLGEKERELGKDADDIGRERDRLEGRREARDSEGRDLREREQNLRRGGDPNCQSAECRQIRERQADLQKERVQDLKAETDLQRRGEKFDREYRRYRAESADLEKRLDRGEGLDSGEHKNRTEARERRRLAGDMDRRMNELDGKDRDARDKKGPPLTRAEREELNKLHGSGSGKTMGDAMREQAWEAEQRVDFDRLSGMSTGELRETARELGRGAQQLGDLEKRVGLGGPQPPAADGGPSARETELAREREKVNAEMNRIGNNMTRQDQAIRNLELARNYTGSQLKDARDKGAPPEEIRRLERKLELENNNVDRAKAEMNRLHREMGHAGNDSRLLHEREGNAALANAGELAAGVVNDYNKSYGDLIDEKGNVRQDVLRREVAQTERSLQQLDKAAPGSPEQKQAIDQLSRQGLDFQTGGDGKVTSWSARTPYAGAVGDAAHDAARLAQLESKPAAQLSDRERPELTYLQTERRAAQDMARRASQPAAPAGGDTDNSLTGRFRREARPGQTFQQWYAEEQQRVAAAPSASPGQRLDAAEARQRTAAADLDREAADRARQSAGAQRAADDRAAERYLRYGRVEGDTAKPTMSSAPTPASKPGQAADASAQRDAQAVDRKAAADEGGVEAWRAARDRQNEQRLAELQKKPSITGAEKQEIGRLRSSLDASRQRQEAERTPKPAPERAAAASEPTTQPRVVEYRNHINDELERTRRAVEQAKDGTPVERLRAEVDRSVAEINEAERDGKDTDAMRGRLASTRKELGDALQREVADADAAGATARTASLERRQQQAALERRDRLDAALEKPRPGASGPARAPVPSRQESAAADRQWEAVRPRTEAEEAAAAQKRKEEMAEREQRTEEEAKERALKFGTLPPDAFKPDPAQGERAAAAADERRAAAAKRDADLAAAAERRKREMQQREEDDKRAAGERALRYGKVSDDTPAPRTPAVAPASKPRSTENAPAQPQMSTLPFTNPQPGDKASTQPQMSTLPFDNPRPGDKASTQPQISTLPFTNPNPPAPDVQVAAVKPSPAAPPARDPAVPAAEPQPTARPSDAAAPGSQPLGEGDPKARENYLAGVQQQIEKRLDGSEFARTAIPDMITAFADQLGPAATDALLAAVFARLPGGKVDAASFLEALFTEVDARAAASGDAETARASRMAHATALDALVNDNPPGSAAGLSEAQRGTLRGALHTLAQKLIEENRALAASGTDPVAQAQRQADVLKLSGMLDPQDQTARTSAEAAAKGLAQLMAGLKSDPSRIALPADLANALRAIERSLATLPAGVDPATVEGLAGALGDGYHALADSLRRAPGGDPTAKAALIVDAEGHEARARLAAGRAVEALAALAPRAGEDASAAAARSGQRAALLERIVTLYPGLSAEEQARIGNIEKLKAERLGSLRSAFAAERDPARIAGHAVPLIRALEASGQAADALKTASDAAARAPDDAMLQGEKLRLQLLAQGATPGDAAKLLEGVPAEARPIAVALALDGFAAAGRVDLIDGLAAAAAASLRSNPTLANTLAVQADLAAIDALWLAGGDPKALSDRIAATRNRLGLESGLPLDTIRTFSAVLDQVDARARAMRAWRQALESGTPPPGGFLGVARDALQSGRLDIAAEAVNRALAGVAGANADLALRQLAEAQALSALVSQRLAAPDVSASQRAAGNTFLAATSDALRKGLAGISENQGKLLNALVAGRNNTPQTQAEFGAGYDQALQRLREAARLGLELDLPGMTPEQRNARVNSRIAELNKQITDKEAAIRKEFAGLREQVRTGEVRERLDQRLAELDALRAQRDGLQDHRLDTQRTTQVLRRGQTETSPVDSRTAELWSIERQLNGYNQGDGPLAWDDIKLTFGRSVQGRTRGLRGDRITQRLRDANPDNWLDTIMVGNEGEYLERRRGQVVMEDPRRSAEQRRAALQQSYRYEADQFKRQGDSYTFNEITGSGELDLNRSRERYAQIESQRVGWLRSDLERAGKAGDPQAFFRSLVGLREAQLAGQIDTYVDYLNDDWTARGPVKGMRVGLYGRATGAALDAASAADAQLHPALIRASYRPPSDLSAEDRQILTDAGFMRDGRYVIPRGAVEDLVRVTTAGTDFAKQSTVDKYVNLRSAAELVATVVLPGGFSSRIAGTLVSRVGMRELAKAAGAREIASVVGIWAGSRVASKVLEAGLFTATSRAARTLLDPSLVLDESAWGFGAFGKEYAHNLMVIGALGAAGSGMNTARQAGVRALGETLATNAAYATYYVATGTAMVFSEAALLTGLDSLVNGNTITQEDFVGNLLTVGMLKASHGLDVPDLRHPNAGKVGSRAADYVGQQARWVEWRLAEHAERQDARARQRFQSWVDQTRAQQLRDSPAGQMLRGRFGGSWEAARKAYNAKEISRAEMEAMLKLRGDVVDALVAEIKAELGGDAQALGSVTPTSDYDISFSGPKAELAVILFNARFGGAWRNAMGFGGAEAAARFDTNMYTRPVFDDIGRGGVEDAWVQEGFAQLQARRNMDDAQWKQHVSETLRGTTTDPARNARMQELLNRVDQRHAEYERTVQERIGSIAAELGVPRESAEADRATRNRLYEDALREILAAKERLARTPDLEVRAAIEANLRHLQSRALFFAAEAYLTQAAINHVVDSVQSTGRGVNATTLLRDGVPSTGEVKLGEDFARQSLIEQKGYIAHYLQHPGAAVPLSMKVGKYFIRVLDAVQQAGKSLKAHTALVETTSFIDGRRSDQTAVQRGLAARQMLAELSARGDLSPAQRAQLAEYGQWMRTAREAYDAVDANADPAKNTKAERERRSAEKKELAKREDLLIDTALAEMQKMGGGDIAAAADRAASAFVAETQKALAAFTTDLASTQNLDTRVALRFRKRRKPKTRAWLLHRGRLRGEWTGGESGIRTHGT